MNSAFINDDTKAEPSSSSSQPSGTSSKICATTAIITINSNNVNNNNSNNNEYCIDTMIINENQPLLINFPSIINDADDDDTKILTNQQITKNNNNNNTISKDHKNMNLLWLICFFILYIIIGGLGFQIFELNAEVQQRENIQLLKNEFLQKYTEIEELDLDNLLEHAMIASTNGITSLLANENETIAYNWNFQEALFFSATVITTIGYGNIAPTTDLGKIFCILYAAVGIPMALLFLSVIVQRLMQFIKRKMLSLNKRIILFLVLVIIILICFMIIPAFIFTYLERTWSYLDSVYYCFVTFTTIGFGDYVPGDDINKTYRGLYKIVLTIFLIMGILLKGLILMMLAVKVFSMFPQFNVMHYFIDDEQLLLSLDDQYNITIDDGRYSSEENSISQVPVVRNAVRHRDQTKQQRKTYGSIHHSYYPILSSTLPLSSSPQPPHPSLLASVNGTEFNYDEFYEDNYPNEYKCDKCGSKYVLENNLYATTTGTGGRHVDNFYVSAVPADVRKLLLHDEIIIHANDSD